MRTQYGQHNHILHVVLLLLCFCLSCCIFVKLQGFGNAVKAFPLGGNFCSVFSKLLW